MKKKVTITLDAQLVPRAKKYARSRGVSLSSVIEDALQRLAADEPSFVSRWQGRFEAAHGDDERFRALSDKYL